MSLTPHVEKIIENDPSGIGVNYKNLLAALLKTGNIAGAEDVLKSGGVTSSRLEHWITVGKTLEVSDALLAFDIFKSNLPTGIDPQIDVVNISTEIARESNSSVALERAYQELKILDELVGVQNDASIEIQQRVGLARGGLQELRSPQDAQVTYQIIAGLVSDETLEKLIAIRSLSRKEQADLRQLRNLHIIALNNYAMSTSRSGINLDQGLAYRNRGLKILPAQPQMLDTRASIYIALGNHSSAVKDALLASSTLPENLSIKITLVKAYILAGNYESAGIILDDISDRNELAPSPSSKIRSDIEDLERKIISGKAA